MEEVEEEEEALRGEGLGVPSGVESQLEVAGGRRTAVGRPLLVGAGWVGGAAPGSSMLVLEKEVGLLLQLLLLLSLPLLLLPVLLVLPVVPMVLVLAALVGVGGRPSFLLILLPFKRVWLLVLLVLLLLLSTLLLLLLLALLLLLSPVVSKGLRSVSFPLRQDRVLRIIAAAPAASVGWGGVRWLGEGKDENGLDGMMEGILTRG